MGSSTAEEAVEIEREKKCAETEKKLVLWLTLDPIFSFLRPLAETLFIGGGRGLAVVAGVSVLSLILKRSHGVVEELQGIRFAQVLFDLMEKSSIKCTYKVGSHAVSFG